ncbi:MAG: hypothetical protein A2Y33_08110 [Spirochaetes bacterium GWF1_51_8]|nr:MAG: hypothetical protein A2Y33_08110 [Spirochaetes bacterium GWF1_51_8]
MKTKPYRAAIIGLGRIGFTLQYDRLREQPASHTAAFGGNRRFRLAGGYDADPARIAEWSFANPGAKAYTSLGEMLGDGRWDVIAVAVDEDEHWAVMRKVLPYRPRLVVLEKPVAPNLEACRKIERLAEKYGVPVQVNHERRFSRDYIEVRRWIEDGRFGGLRTVKGEIYSNIPAWMKGDRKHAHGTILVDGTHLVDIVRFLTGGKTVLKKAREDLPDSAGNTGGITAVGHSGGASLALFFGYTTAHFTFELDLVFENARVRIGNGVLELWESRESPYYEGFYSLIRDKKVKPFRKSGYFAGMVKNCAEFLDGKSELGSPLSDGIRAVAVMEKLARKSG